MQRASCGFSWLVHGRQRSILSQEPIVYMQRGSLGFRRLTVSFPRRLPKPKADSTLSCPQAVYNPRQPTISSLGGRRLIRLASRATDTGSGRHG